MPGAWDDERERMLWMMFTRFMNRGYGGDVVQKWFDEFELHDGGDPGNSFYPANEPRYALPTILTIDQIYGESLEPTPPTVSGGNYQYIDCHPLNRVSGTPDTQPIYILTDPTIGTVGVGTEYGQRIAVIPGCLVGHPAYEPQLIINFNGGGTAPLDLGGAGLPHFDPLSGILSFESDPAAQFDPALDGIEITAWRWVGPSLADRLNAIVGGGPGGVGLTKCDRFLVSPVPGAGNPTNWFPLLVNTLPVTLDLNQDRENLGFINGNKMVVNYDYEFRANPSTGFGEVRLLNDTVEANRYVAEDCDEAEFYVVTQ